MSLAVVTGAPGWLGTSLVRGLVEGMRYQAGETRRWQVRCIVQPAIDTSEIERLDVGVVRADLRDRRALRGACDGAELVIHAAGIIHPRRVQDLFDINVEGT